MLRQFLASSCTRVGSRIALAVVIGLVGASTAATAIAATHDGAPAIASGHGDGYHDEGGNSNNSTAVAINTTDNSLVFELTFAILNVTGNVVDNQNVADAYASCDGCQTVAISIQTLLVQGVANVVAPINEASARNQNCQQCDTVAVAYQFVVAPGTTLKFTPDGRREIAYIKRELERLRQHARRGMTGAQIVVAVAALMKQYAAILGTQLVPASQHGAGVDGTATSAAAPPATTTSSTGASSSAANPGVSATTSMTTSPTSSTTSTGAPGAGAGTTGATPTSAPTDPGVTTPTTTGTTPTTTGTTPTTTGTTPTTTGTTPTTTGTTPTTTGTTPTTTGTTPTTTGTSGKSGGPTTSGATITTSGSTTPTTP